MTVVDLRPRQQGPVLPEKRKTRHGKELTLVLDLDETLVHCTVDPIANPDHSFEVHFNGEEFQVGLPLKITPFIPLGGA